MKQWNQERKDPVCLGPPNPPDSSENLRLTQSVMLVVGKPVSLTNISLLTAHNNLLLC